MCGIVGLLVKTPALRERLGALMVPMLIGMTERGPDSAGLAVFSQQLDAGKRKLSLYSGFTPEGDRFDWSGLAAALNGAMNVDAQVEPQANPPILTFPLAPSFLKTCL